MTPEAPSDAPWFLRHPRWTLALVALSGIALVLLVTVIAELSLRRAFPSDSIPETDRTIRFREQPRNLDVSTRPPEELLDKSDGLADVAVRFQTDENGFILPARRHAAPDRTVLFLGGSTTECRFVPDSLRFPALAGRLLEERSGLRINALNAGRGGNHALHSLTVFLGKGVPQDPDVVVMMHAINDLAVLLRQKDYWNDHSTRSLLIDECPTARCRLRGAASDLGEALFPALRARVMDRRRSQRDQFSTPVASIDTAFVTGRFRQALVSFVTTARAWGATPVLMTQANRFTPVLDPPLLYPSETTGVSYEDYRDLYRQFNDLTREVAADLDVPLVDLDSAIPQDAVHMYDQVHLTPEGSRRVAALVAEKLATLPELTAPPTVAPTPVR